MGRSSCWPPSPSSASMPTYPARCHGHGLARANYWRHYPRTRLHRLSHRLPAARASCRLIATIRLLPAPSNNGPDQAVAKHRPPT
ncbi:hypothetical protein ACLOJK_034922, partial [Asimina triloba]